MHIYMLKKVLRSFYISLEWRILAFIITNAFFWITTRHFWTAAGLTVLLQSVLFVSYTIWHLFRHELHKPLVPTFITGRPKTRDLHPKKRKYA